MFETFIALLRNRTVRIAVEKLLDTVEDEAKITNTRYFSVIAGNLSVTACFRDICPGNCRFYIQYNPGVLAFGSIVYRQINR